jgi:hypothetical protein
MYFSVAQGAPSPTPGEFKLIGFLVNNGKKIFLTVNPGSDSSFRIYFDEPKALARSIKGWSSQLVEAQVKIIQITGSHTAKGNLLSYKPSSLERPPVYDSKLKVLR